MAPMKTAGAKAKAAQKKAEQDSKLQKKLEKAVLLIQKQDLKEAAEKKKKAEKKEKEGATDKDVAKLIYDNFRNWSRELTDLTIRQGLSLRQRLQRDKTLAIKNLLTEPMGKLYYNKLKGLYGSALPAEMLLDVEDDGQWEDHKLKQAFGAFFSKKKNDMLLQGWFASAGEPNQKNCVAMCEGMLMINPVTCDQNNGLALEMMDFCNRHSLKDKFPKEMGAMTRYMEQALVKTFGNYRKHNLDRLDFWAKHRAKFHFVVPEESAAACFECGDKWVDVADHLTLAVNSGELGRVLFSSAYKEMSASKVTRIMETHAKDLSAKDSVTAQTMEHALKALSEEVKAMGGDITDVFKEPCDCEVMYLGHKLILQAATHLEMFNLIVWARLKEWAVCAGKLQPIWCEVQLANDDKIGPFPEGFSVSEEIFKECTVVRKVSLSYMEDKTPCASEVQSIIEEHGAFLLQMDKRFKIETAYFQHMVDGGADQRIKDVMFQAITWGPGKTLQDCVKEASHVCKSALFLWVGVGSQSLALSVRDMVRDLASNAAPKFTSANDPFLKKCRDEAAKYVRVKVTVEKTTTTLVGKDAVVHMLNLAVEKTAEGKPVVYKDTAQCVAFAYVLDEVDRASLARITKGVSSVASVSADKEDEGPVSKKAKKESSKTIVANLFKSKSKGKLA